MKKVLIFMLVILCAISSVCLAMEEGDVENTGDEDAIYLDNFDDFINAYNGNESSEMEAKEYYREFLSYSREQDSLYTPTDTVKAKVVDVGDRKTTYGMSYYTPYKIEYQPIQVEILEGEYEGKIVSTQYILTADTYGNVKIPEIKIGDKIFVAVEVNETTGEISADATSYDARNSRFPAIITLSIVAALILIMYGKTNGLKSVLLAVLIFDLVFVITLPQIVKNNDVITLEASDKGFPSISEIENDESITILSVDDNAQPTKVEMVKKSNSVVWLIILDVIIISAVCLINHLGLGKKTLVGFGITALMLVFTVLLLFGVNILTNMNGNTFEAISVTESIVNRNIDFGIIYMLSILIVASVMIPGAVSKVLLKYRSENYTEISRNYLVSQVGVIVAISLIVLLLKVIALAVFRYTTKEMLNSEMVLSEVARMLVVIISVSLTMPITELICRLQKSRKTMQDNTDQAIEKGQE